MLLVEGKRPLAEPPTLLRQTTQALFGCFSNRLFLRCTASDLAEKVAKELSEAEFEETRAPDCPQS